MERSIRSVAARASMLCSEATLAESVEGLLRTLGCGVAARRASAVEVLREEVLRVGVEERDEEEVVLARYAGTALLPLLAGVTRGVSTTEWAMEVSTLTLRRFEELCAWVEGCTGRGQALRLADLGEITAFIAEAAACWVICWCCWRIRKHAERVMDTSTVYSPSAAERTVTKPAVAVVTEAASWARMAWHSCRSSSERSSSMTLMLQEV